MYQRCRECILPHSETSKHITFRLYCVCTADFAFRQALSHVPATHCQLYIEEASVSLDLPTSEFSRSQKEGRSSIVVHLVVLHSLREEVPSFQFRTPWEVGFETSIPWGWQGCGCMGQMHAVLLDISTCASFKRYSCSTYQRWCKWWAVECSCEFSDCVQHLASRTELEQSDRLLQVRGSSTMHPDDSKRSCCEPHRCYVVFYSRLRASFEQDQ